jgi:hypothetical protein
MRRLALSCSAGPAALANSLAMLAAHRKTPNFAREQREKIWARVEQILGSRPICGSCGATFKTYDDKCEAGVDETPCAGGVAIAAAEILAKKQLGIT